MPLENQFTPDLSSPAESIGKFFEDAYSGTVDFIKEHPALTATAAAAAAVGVFCLTRGRCGGAAAKVEGAFAGAGGVANGAAHGVETFGRFPSAAQLIRTGIPLNAETRAAAAAGNFPLRPGVLPSTESLVGSGVPISAGRSTLPAGFPKCYETHPVMTIPEPLRDLPRNHPMFGRPVVSRDVPFYPIHVVSPEARAVHREIIKLPIPPHMRPEATRNILRALRDGNLLRDTPLP